MARQQQQRIWESNPRAHQWLSPITSKRTHCPSTEGGWQLTAPRGQSSRRSPSTMQRIKRRQRLSHPNLAPLLRWHKVGEGEVCGGPERQYMLVFELQAYSLFHEIKMCCKRRKPIPQAEICRMFEAVVDCLSYLRDNHTLHGDIKVSNIFMNNNREVKIVDSFLLKKARTAYEVVLEDPHSMSLLTPEQLSLLRTKLFDSLSSQVQSEIFMVGMSMIECTTIMEAMRGYDLESLQMRAPFFVHMMQQIQSCGYSYELSDLIMNCVHRLPQNRPSYAAFLTKIRQIRQRVRQQQ